MTKECSVEHINIKFHELRKRFGEVESAHDKYLMTICKENEVLDVKEEEWFVEVQNNFDQALFVKVDYISKRQESIKVESKAEMQRKKLQRIQKLERAAFLESIQFLTETIAKKESLNLTIKEAQLEAKSQLERCRDVQHELIPLVEDYEIPQITEWLSNLKVKFLDVNAEANKVIEKRNTDQRISNSSLKLERMRMPTFDGRIREYPRFKADFIKQVLPSVKDADSQAYVLKSCLIGEPLDIAKSVDDDITEMWSRLDERYGRTRKLADAVMADIKRLRLVSEGDNKRMVELVNIVERGYRDLVRAGMSQEISNTVAMSWIEEKLPPMIKREWHMSVVEVSGGEDNNDFQHLLKFLLKQKRCIEFGIESVRSQNNIPAARNFHIDDANSMKRGCYLHGFVSTSHTIYDCFTYKRMSPKERLDVLVQNNACFYCLQNGHLRASCPEKVECGIDQCKKFHHKSLHEASNLGVVSKCVSSNTCLLQLMTVKSKYPGIQVNVLWDTGSTISMITFKKAKEMKLVGRKTKLSIVKVGGTNEEIDSCQYDVPLLNEDGEIETFFAYGINKISTPIEKTNIQKVLSLFKDVSESNIHRPTGEIDMLVGFEYAGFHPVKTHAVDHLLLMKNMFGSCLGGSHPLVQETTKKIVKNASLFFAVGKPKIEDFFNTELLGVECSPKCGSCKCGKCPLGGKQYTLQEERELAVIEKGLSLQGNQWTASYPYKKDPQELPNNYNAAFAMLKSTEKRLSRNEGHAQMYQQQIEDMMERGVARKLDRTELIKYKGPVFYVSHHDVIKSDSLSTPMRIVFNSSQTFNGHALNEYWMKGPDLVNNLVGVLLRFREKQCGISGDIRKMYHTVKICERDQHVHRFLWRDMKTEKKPDIYAMTVVTFGDKPASAIASLALRKTAEMHANLYPEAARTVLENSYVDDIVDSVDTIEQAKTITSDINNLIGKGNFIIKHWKISGDTNHNAESIVKPETDESNSKAKVLGMVWNSSTDTLSFKVKLNFSVKIRKVHTSQNLTMSDLPSAIPHSLTKRMILSQINGIFDPLGLIGPFTARAKIMLRKLINANENTLGWDDAIPDEYHDEWSSFFAEMLELDQLEFVRPVKPKDAVDLPTLIVFSDASESAYGACAYIRWKLLDGSFRCHLLISKNHLAPKKKITIVRLELNGALVAKRLKDTIESEIRVKFGKCYFIVDSSIVRAMIQKESYGFNTFAGVRVGEIQERTNPLDWYWVEGSSNVADMLTRGKVSFADIREGSIWQTGPLFLQEDEIQWPIESSYSGSALPDEVKLINLQCVRSSSVSEIIDITAYSNYYKLLRVTARVRSVYSDPSKRTLKSIARVPSQPEISAAEELWVKDAQYVMKDELKGTELKRLCATEVNGVIVVGGRLESWMHNTYNNLRPPILPYNHPLSKLYAQTIHDKYHKGISAVAAIVRQKFWIIGILRLLKSIRYKCSKCKLLDKKQQEQVMGQIPANRLKPAPAWSYTSIDFFGPYEIKGEINKRSRGKGFAVIFNCMLSRAIHLDIAVDYGTSAFLLVLRRFISMRGCPIKIRSDQGSQLVAANKELKGVIRDVDAQKLKEFGASNKFDWEFSAGDAPWQNACAEALIKSVKRSLHSVIGQQVLTFSEMQTMLFEVADLLNGRPIGRHPTNTEDGSYLTPNDLLLGRSSNYIPREQFVDSKLQRRYVFLQQMVSAFWTKWITHYFPSLLIRQKWHASRRNVKVNDIVLVQDSNQIRGKWKLGRIVEAEPSLRDGFVRNVSIQYKNLNSKTFTKILRPVQKIVVIVPVDEADDT